MTSTMQMPFAAVITSFSEAFTGMLDEAAHVRRVSAEAYLRGLDVVVEQHKLARESSRQWVSDTVSVQSDLGRQVLGSYTSVTDRSAEAPAGATDAAEGAGTDVVGRTRSAAPPVKRRPTTARRRTAAGGSTTARRQTAADGPTTARRQTAAGGSTTARRSPRRPTTPAATAALASAVGAGLTKWTTEGYDSLTAAEVIEKLPGFSQRDLREVDAYERSHQGRQTVLQRIESLREPEPVAGYDELTVPEIQRRLTAGDEARATSVRDYERSHKKREGVLHAAQARLDRG